MKNALLFILVWFLQTSEIPSAVANEAVDGGPLAFVNWSTVDCPRTCGNYSISAYEGLDCSESRCVKSSSHKDCYLGACDVFDTVQSNAQEKGTNCPLMCRLYLRAEHIDENCIKSRVICARDSRVVYTYVGCDKSACQDCRSIKHKDSITGQTFVIPEATVGRSAYTTETCGVDKQPLGKVECIEDKDRGATWGNFSLNQNCHFSDLPYSPISNFLQTLMQDQQENVGETLQAVVNITMDTNLTEVDLLYTAAILEKTETLNNMNTNVVENVLEIYKKVLLSDKAVAAQQRGKAGNRILEIVDTMGDKFTPNSGGDNRIVTDSLGLEVWDLKKQLITERPIGLQLKKATERHTLKTIFEKEDSNEARAKIMVENEMISEMIKDAMNKDIRLSLTAHINTKMFDVIQHSSLNPSNHTLNSKVMSAKIIVDGVVVTDLKGFNVTTMFLPRKKLSFEKRRGLTVCAYWNFSCDDNSGCWSTNGCNYQAQEDYDVCVCNHLTNFAALLAWDDVSKADEIHTHVLSGITIGGLSMSIFGLSITVLTPVVFRKLRETDQQRTLLNLALAELCAWIVFLAGFSQTQNHVGCIVAAALLHYFILASFMWMLAEAVMHYRLFVKVLGTYSHRYMLKTGIPAWGFPVLPVLMVLATDPNQYIRDDTYCWLSVPAMYYAFALPVGVVILCNLFSYAIIVINICKKSSAALSQQETGKRTQTDITVSFLIFILFGLSWTFGFMAVSDAKVVFEYIFCIINSLQGFLIFLFFTALNKHVRDSWIRLWRRLRRGMAERHTEDKTPQATKLTPLTNN